jgi:hypothetical protein
MKVDIDFFVFLWQDFFVTKKEKICLDNRRIHVADRVPQTLRYGISNLV